MSKVKGLDKNGQGCLSFQHLPQQLIMVRSFWLNLSSANVFLKGRGLGFPPTTCSAAVPGTDWPTLQGSCWGQLWLCHSNLSQQCSTCVSSAGSDFETFRSMLYKQLCWKGGKVSGHIIFHLWHLYGKAFPVAAFLCLGFLGASSLSAWRCLLGVYEGRILPNC